ncbi:MAG: sensor histidine kinase [Flavobacteriaceae bacterium]|nr:sensor histidine kinase [Flavobacteriaceae bacterium]
MKYLLCFLFFAFGLGVYAQVDLPLDSLLNKAFVNKDSAQYYFTEAKRKLKTRADTANYLYFKFFQQDVARRSDSTVYYSELALPRLRGLDSLERMRKIYERLHFQELRSGQYEAALDFCQKALSIAEELKDTSMISLHLSDKSIVYHDFEDYARGVEYGKKAFDIMINSENINYRYILFANNATGINFDDWGKADSALYYHFENLKYLSKVEDSLPYAFIFNNIGNTLLKQKRYDEAKKYIREALKLNTRRNRAYNLASNYTNLATIAYRQGDYSEAEKQFELAKKYAEESESIEKVRDVIQQEAWFYKEIKDYRKALEKQEAFYVLKDSVFSTERAATVAEMETKYETEKKEKDLAQTRANLAETELKVKKRNNLIYGSLGFAMLLGLLGYLLYNQQKLKNRQLKKEGELKAALSRIETQNKLQEQRLRISRDLHDNIGSQLTFVTSSVENLKYGLGEKDQKVAQKLTDIGTFTTQTIYELRDTIWAMNKSEISSEDLQARIANFIDKAGSARDEVLFNFNVAHELAEGASFSSVQGMNIYRIIQEAVNNALKYANASNITVNFSKTDLNYLLRIEDDGEGFDIEEVSFGNGINNIKKRAKDLEGNAIITSAPGKGTVVEVTF